jgi:hypothetical protein
MFNVFRSKKAPVCGERIVHGSGSTVSLGVSAEMVEGRERKKDRLQYRRFIVVEMLRAMRGCVGAVSAGWWYISGISCVLYCGGDLAVVDSEGVVNLNYSRSVDEQLSPGFD